MLRAQNSLTGFERARALLDIDREMAGFRAITAEEEAATALFRSLQLRGYEGANRIRLKDHFTKSALGPFIRAVQHSLSSGGNLTLRLTLEVAAPKLTVRLPLAQFDLPDEFELTLAQPLGMLGARVRTH